MVLVAVPREVADAARVQLDRHGMADLIIIRTGAAPPEVTDVSQRIAGETSDVMARPRTTSNSQTEVPVGVPRCPTCGSTNIRRITGGRKAARVAMIGVFAAPKAMKSYECLNCRARW